jgi:hypothetical protein
MKSRRFMHSPLPSTANIPYWRALPNIGPINHWRAGSISRRYCNIGRTSFECRVAFRRVASFLLAREHMGELRLTQLSHQFF